MGRERQAQGRRERGGIAERGPAQEPAHHYQSCRRGHCGGGLAPRKVIRTLSWRRRKDRGGRAASGWSAHPSLACSAPRWKSRDSSHWQHSAACDRQRQVSTGPGGTETGKRTAKCHPAQNEHRVENFRKRCIMLRQARATRTHREVSQGHPLAVVARHSRTEGVG